MRAIISTLSLAVLLAGVAPGPVAAQTTAVDRQALLNQIEALLKQVQDLQNALAQLQAQKPQAITRVSYIVSPLQQGDSGDSVKIVQALLAADPAIYPEARITGFYGPLTVAAVRRFQEKNGIEALGVVDPKTRAKLDEVLAANPLGLEAAPVGRRPCAIVLPGNLIASGWLAKTAQPVVTECQTLPPGIAPELEESAPAATSTPPAPTPAPEEALAPAQDVTAPVISELAEQSVSIDGARTAWTTDEPAITKIYYSTAGSPIAATVILNNATTTSRAVAFDSVQYPWSYRASNDLFSTEHIAEFVGLDSATLYAYVVEAIDASGNAASSTARVFITGSAGEISPAITSRLVELAPTAALISWTTNVISDAQIWYGTTLSYGLMTPLDSTLLANHSQTLSGLVPNTLYYYQVKSRDAAGNLKSAAGQFTTRPAAE